MTTIAEAQAELEAALADAQLKYIDHPARYSADEAGKALERVERAKYELGRAFNPNVNPTENT